MNIVNKEGSSLAMLLGISAEKNEELSEVFAKEATGIMVGFEKALKVDLDQAKACQDEGKTFEQSVEEGVGRAAHKYVEENILQNNTLEKFYELAGKYTDDEKVRYALAAEFSTRVYLGYQALMEKKNMMASLESMDNLLELLGG